LICKDKLLIEQYSKDVWEMKEIFKRLSTPTSFFYMQFITTTRLSINRSTRLKTLVIGIKIPKESDAVKTRVR